MSNTAIRSRQEEITMSQLCPDCHKDIAFCRCEDTQDPCADLKWKNLKWSSDDGVARAIIRQQHKSVDEAFKRGIEETKKAMNWLGEVERITKDVRKCLRHHE